MSDSPTPSPRMSAADAAALLTLFAERGIQVWLDGGWAVDAVLGRQTRLHEDIDIALCHDDVPALRRLLEEMGFRDVPRDDTRECNFVLGDDRGRQVDVHSFRFDERGRCVFGVPYPIESLTGRGVIAGRELDCIAPEWLLKFRSGYKLRPKDFLDIAALCERFGFTPPPVN
jgi:lincosamide nucleotidyltransferase A/C/D/E